ncbi:UDP-N-acetylmuramoylalanyl-D-glutamate--2,6-diaminopimelate ligase [Modicisalibacter xianhensis]|uniref:UDP-N-acetylmuramoyl-L-alanyl-D-glutamate--2,6-diaminopimelate ligase n=1 Tax=Modicisalibacter xianhensis TaxID=442341 RepID=A0A1I3BZH9_9GAMM|nr:UDP-N-acetylmuramoyl-L-alanyl-D-glutamate--2,6-diaminopimelate ligase [Halomonas xianhensis]SFH67603.1 UDP-N-acetylmuramoylalanyl-D-glutamate--2,6-diaminopimelate ligase [Halomonas xianhensis]
MIQVEGSRLRQTIAKLWPGTQLPDEALASAAMLRLCRDSRDVSTGEVPTVFVAVPGVHVDGRRFIAQALADGPRLVLAEACDKEAESAPLPTDERVVALADLGRRLGELGRELFAVPESLEVIGVTGTNGKSSVTHYIAALSDALGCPSGVIGTLGWGRLGQLTDSGLTTPGALELQWMLGQMASSGIRRVAMEVSSHALMQERLAGCRLKAAVFTNLSRDHLDYHGSMAAYAAAKARLFRREEISLAVVNGDDALARLMLAGVTEGVRVLATGRQEATTLRVLDWLPHAEGQRVLIATPDGERALELGLMGRFNLDNVLLAMATLYGLGGSLEALCEAANSLSPVPGRMQVLTRPGAPTVIVDYAHTPDALTSALSALRDHLPRQARLWCLFGCGGDRDAGKRPLMAQAVEPLVDRIVISDDNPRSEDPAAIRQQILTGLSEEAQSQAWCVDGRGQAIDRIIADAGPEDIILIAGKGHETYQEIQGRRLPFSDIERAEAALQSRKEGA